jgi:plastocyanin
MRKAVPVIMAVALLGAMTLAVSSAPAGGRTTKIKVGNNFFSPEKKTVKRGTKVRFKWEGGALHNVTKRKGPGGKIASKTTKKSGVNYTKTFKRKGTYKLICTIHPSMKLKLKVR